MEKPDVVLIYNAWETITSKMFVIHPRKIYCFTNLYKIKEAIIIRGEIPIIVKPNKSKIIPPIKPVAKAKVSLSIKKNAKAKAITKLGLKAGLTNLERKDT